MQMKKGAKVIAKIFMLIICSVFLSGCFGCGGCFGCDSCSSCFGCGEDSEGYHDAGIDPGTYLFEIDSYEAFVNVEIEGTMNTRFDSVQTSTEITIKISPERYYWHVHRNSCTSYIDEKLDYKFEDCYITAEFDINGQKQVRSFYIGNDGKYEGTFSFTLNPTYAVKTECKISNVTGQVFAPMRQDYTFDYDGLSYVTTKSGGCELKHYGVSEIAHYNKNHKNLTFHSTVFTPEGTELRFNVLDILSRQSIMYFFDGTMTATKTICLKGTYQVEDIITIFGSLKKYFPNIEKFAVEHLYYDDIFYGSCAFPESGITIYLENTESVFAESLKDVYFVKDVKPYSEFSEV